MGASSNFGESDWSDNICGTLTACLCEKETVLMVQARAAAAAFTTAAAVPEHAALHLPRRLAARGEREWHPLSEVLQEGCGCHG